MSRHRKKVTKEGHLLPGDHRGRDLLGHRKKVSEGVALTNWRPQRKGLVVRTQK